MESSAVDEDEVDQLASDWDLDDELLKLAAERCEEEAKDGAGDQQGSEQRWSEEGQGEAGQAVNAAGRDYFAGASSRNDTTMAVHGI